MSQKLPTPVPKTPPTIRAARGSSTLVGMAALLALGTACSGSEEESDDTAEQGNQEAPQANPSGGAPQVTPSGGAPQVAPQVPPQVDPSGGAPQVVPTGGAPQFFPTGGAPQVPPQAEPSGGAPQVAPTGGGPQIPPQPAPSEEDQ